MGATKQDSYAIRKPQKDFTTQIEDAKKDFAQDLALGLSRDDIQRESFRYTPGIASEFLTTYSSRDFVMSNTDYTTALFNYMGLPPPILKDHVCRLRFPRMQ